jgi:hypothetical protein
MAVRFVGTTSGSAINGGNVAITLPGNYNTGDCAIVTVSIGASIAATLSVASSSGATTFYTQIVTTIRTSNLSFGVFRRIIASTAEQGISITGPGTLLASVTGAVHIFDAVSTSTPEDVAATSTTGGSVSPLSPPITPVTFGCGIISAAGLGTQISALLTGPTGFLNFQSTTGADTDPATVGQAWIPNGSTSTKTPGAFTSSATATWASATIALRPATITWSEASLTSADPVATEARRVVIRSY